MRHRLSFRISTTEAEYDRELHDDSEAISEMKLVLRITNNHALLKNVAGTLSINREAFQIVYFLITTIKLCFF